MTYFRRLVLFDVDGTLIWPDGAGRRAMKLALQRVVGYSGPVDHHPMAGKTDPQIIAELLSAADLPAEQLKAIASDVFRAMAEILPRTLAAADVQVCPGVPELLAAVATNPEILPGLLTGNLSTTAPLKLTAAGLDPKLFRVGAFGSDDADRNKLPGVAIARARDLAGLTFSGAEVVIIGDTPADVACARPWGAQAIAVATGNYDEYDLGQAGADVIFGDLADTQAVMAAILADIP
jgi:phosphoglycolate phosphatase